ncbi:MAG: protein kinase [Kofleriaceae bacterium]
MADDRDPDELPAGEPTYAEPDHLHTVDALSPRARAARAVALSSSPGAPSAPTPRAEPEGIRVGRYQLLEMVGAGGMGLVWGAWDPELERRVALKLLQPTQSAARERILSEGQVLAKLSHPNVVPIYDVGVMGEQVYLVMEWVRGITLRAFARSAPSLHALLEAYRQAAQGLLAAHQRGIVHRDFKPDNVIRGDDGRVRVLDFGLAQSEVTDAAARTAGALVAGTPHYMAPEQVRGEAALAATDQYAFCVSLGEALAALAKREQRRVPGWLQAITARGTTEDPAQRFASMSELLDALDRDPARRWRRGGAGVAILAAAIGAFAFGRARASETALAPCAGSVAEIATVWAPAQRAQLVSHLRGLGSALTAEEPQRLADDLDAYSARWAEQHRRSCLARERRELSAVLFDRRLACLARGKASLAAVAELLGAVPADGLAAALVARRSLPDVATCAAVDDSAVLPPAPALAAQVRALAPAIERARVLGLAQRPDALEAARSAVADTRRVGYAPLLARALLVQGRAEVALFLDDARATLTEALSQALLSSDDVLALEAYARLIWVQEYRDPPESWLVMSQLAARTGGRGRFGRALMFNNFGGLLLRAQRRDEGRAMLERALAESDLRQGPLSAGASEEQIELVGVLQNLSLIELDPGVRQRLLERATASLQATIGENHPRTFAMQELTAMLTGAPGPARAELETACLGYQRWGLTTAHSACAFEIGWLAEEAGDDAGARRWMKVAAADHSLEAERATTQVAATYLRVRDPETSAVALQADLRQLATVAAAVLAKDGFWHHVDAADAEVVLALGHERLGRAADALAAWRRALAALHGIELPVYERRLARLRAAVAERTADRREAQQLASAALTWYRAVGGYEATIARLAPLAAK